MGDPAAADCRRGVPIWLAVGLVGLFGACVDLTLPDDADVRRPAGSGGSSGSGGVGGGTILPLDAAHDPSPADPGGQGTGGKAVVSTLGNGLVAHWPLDQQSGSRFDDLTGKTGPGFALNGATWQTVNLPGPLGASDHSALHFDGSNDFATMGISGLPDNGAARSVSLWFNLGADATRTQDFISLTDGTATALNLGVRNGLLVAASWGGAVLVSVSAPPAGGWHHLSYTFDKVVNRLYLDGTLMAEGTAKPQTGSVREAWLASSRARNDFYAGALDDLRIYDRMLNDDEVSALAAGESTSASGDSGGNGGAPVAPSPNLVGYWKLDESAPAAPFADSSGNATYAKGVGGPVASGGAPGLSFANPHALTFNGSQCAVIGNPAVLNFSGAITMTAWVNVGQRSGTRNVVAHGPSDTDTGLRLDANSYAVYAAGGSNLHRASFTIPDDDANSWVHLAGLYDGAAWRVYRNGHQVGATIDGVGALIGRGNWSIGGTGTCADRFFRGTIDDVRIYHTALTSADLRRIADGIE